MSLNIFSGRFKNGQVFGISWCYCSSHQGQRGEGYIHCFSHGPENSRQFSLLVQRLSQQKRTIKGGVSTIRLHNLYKIPPDFLT